MVKQREYEVALSYASEDRDYVAKVASRLKAKGVRVFYDDHDKVNVWGRDLHTHLSSVYTRAQYTVIFISQAYANKIWTTYELESAQRSALEGQKESVLPARFDDTELPGISPATAYLDLRTTSSEELANHILRKVRRANRFAFIRDRGFRRGALAAAVLAAGLLVFLTTRPKTLRDIGGTGWVLLGNVNCDSLDRFAVSYFTPLEGGEGSPNLRYGDEVRIARDDRDVYIVGYRKSGQALINAAPWQEREYDLGPADQTPVVIPVGALVKVNRATASLCLRADDGSVRYYWVQISEVPDRAKR
jgi:hypothetical protein